MDKEERGYLLNAELLDDLVKLLALIETSVEVADGYPPPVLLSKSLHMGHQSLAGGTVGSVDLYDRGAWLPELDLHQVIVSDQPVKVLYRQVGRATISLLLLHGVVYRLAAGEQEDKEDAAQEGYIEAYLFHNGELSLVWDKDNKK